MSRLRMKCSQCDHLLVSGDLVPMIGAAGARVCYHCLDEHIARLGGMAFGSEPDGWDLYYGMSREDPT